MEIKREAIPYTEKAAATHSSVCVEGDIVVPDVCPDIARVLLADANAVVEATELKGTTLYLSGTVSFCVLYRPDEKNGEDCVKSISASFPFSESVEVAGGDACTFSVHATTEHIGFTLVNSRKLSAKVIASLHINGYKKRVLIPVSDIDEKQVQCKKERYHVYTPVADRHADIKLSDFLTIPAHMPDIDEILKVDAFATPQDCKVMNEKIMVKGILNINTLYTPDAEDKVPQLAVHQIPFTEIVEAPDVDEDCAVCVLFHTKQANAVPRGDMNGDTKIISAEIVLDAHMKASKTMQMGVVGDCYSIVDALSVEREKVQLSSFITAEQASFSEKQLVELPKNESITDVLSVSCKPILRETVVEDGTLFVRGSLVSFLLYQTEKESDKVKSAVTETEFEWRKTVDGADSIAECDLWLLDAKAEKIGANGVQVSVSLGVYPKVLKPQSVEMITDCMLTPEENVLRAPRSLCVYCVQKGDTLWEVAKRYTTTIDKIKTANGLTGDVLPVGMKILVPKAR